MRLAAALIGTLLVLAGCGSSDDRSTSEPSASPSAGQASSPAEAAQPSGPVVDIAIKDGKVTPQGDRVEVEVGQQVTLNITSDADEEIHVHSDPEHTYEIAPGETVAESFTIDTPGQVAVEAHHLDVTVVQLVVRP